MARFQGNRAACSGKMMSPFIHERSHPLIKHTSLKIIAESQKRRGDTPRINSLIDWIGKQVGCSIAGCFLRKKLVRDDVEILRDKEASWIEYCILFYSLARNLGVECAFGVSGKRSDDDDEDTDKSSYYLIAKEGVKTAIISPYAGVIIFPKDRRIGEIGAAEFFRSIGMLYRTSPLSAMHTTPLLYYVADSYDIWIHRPEPNILSLTVTKEEKNEKEDILQVRYIFEGRPLRMALTLVDYKNKVVRTNSQTEAKKFLAKKQKEFKLSADKGEGEIIGEAKRILPAACSGAVFCKGTEKVLAVFAKDLERHYDHSYA